MPPHRSWTKKSHGQPWVGGRVTGVPHHMPQDRNDRSHCWRWLRAQILSCELPCYFTWQAQLHLLLPTACCKAEWGALVVEGTEEQVRPAGYSNLAAASSFHVKRAQHIFILFHLCLMLFIEFWLCLVACRILVPHSGLNLGNSSENTES